MPCSTSATSCKTTNILYHRAGEKRRYSVDFSPLMDTSETISGTPTVTDASGDFTITSITTSGQTVLAWLDGGTKNKMYNIVFTVTTSAGQTLIVDARLQVT